MPKQLKIVLGVTYNWRSVNGEERYDYYKVGEPIYNDESKDYSNVENIVINEKEDVAYIELEDGYCLTQYNLNRIFFKQV